METKKQRLFVKITRFSLPQVKDKYPFIYLERGRMEVDDSSIKWIDGECNIVRLPIATISCILLGPGTSVTHEAIKVLSASNCTVCWVGEDGLLFYAVGHTPTSTSVQFRRQMQLACDKAKSLEVAKRMFTYRFPEAEVNGKDLGHLMGMEGKRVKELYEKKAEEYKIGWKGRSYTPGKFELSDITNKILTSASTALYAIVTSVIVAMGYSVHIGFIHSGSPLPFVYDIADLYKEYLCIDLAFFLTLETGGEYNKNVVSDHFRKRVLEMDLMNKIPKDINNVLEVK